MYFVIKIIRFFLTRLNSIHKIGSSFHHSPKLVNFSNFVYLFVDRIFADTSHYTSLIIIDYWHFDFHRSARFRVSLIRA